MNNEPSLIADETARAAAKTAAPCASQFLEEQLRLTRRALKDSITDLERAAVHALNPRPWFKHHPAVCISVLAAATSAIGLFAYKKISARRTARSHKRKWFTTPKVKTRIDIKTETPGWKKASAFLGSHLFRIIRKALLNALMARYMVTRIEPGDYSEGDSAGVGDLLADEALKAAQ